MVQRQKDSQLCSKKLLLRTDHIAWRRIKRRYEFPLLQSASTAGPKAGLDFLLWVSSETCQSEDGYGLYELGWKYVRDSDGCA